MEAKQLDAYKKNNALLCQFIVRLSSFYEGFSGAIDSELKTLRSHLSGTPNFSLAAVSIEKLNKSLQSQEITLRKYSIDTVSSIEEATKQLQKIVFEDTELKALTTQQLIKLNQPIDDIFSIYKLYAKAIALYRIALNKQIVGLETSTSDTQTVDTSAPKAQEDNPHYRSIMIELNQLIASYAQKKPDDRQLRDIKQRLEDGMNEDQLLKSCVVILRMIVQDAMSEASLTGKVIQGLHRSLGEIGSSVSATIEGSTTQFEQRQAGNEVLKQHLDSFEEVVSESHSLEALKAQTQDKVNTLLSTLQKQQVDDQQGQEDLIALLTSMQDRIETLQNQTSVYKKKLAEQAAQSRTDPLTRLPNRQAYNEKLDIAYAQFKQNNMPLTVAVVDIDHFKSINDRFGHAAGDKTLQVVSKYLKQQIGNNEFIARWGGEEFVMLLPNTPMKHIEAKLNEIRTALSQMPFKFKQQKVQITASFGATSFRKNEDKEAVFERADEYLYKAKRNGRNLVITDISEQ